ncbi:MAG: sigma-70 family RNA polymerase sigma factor [Elusimicrobiales bacterium]|nr:sigma-70 family RNA polymerase sigma factor [Elusimicrobiales bacterium]
MDAEELFEKFSPMVYNLALRLSGNKADAQDIAQDAFLKAVRGLGDLREHSFAGTWLYRITVNVWKNRVRSEKRRSFWKTFSLDWGGDGGEEKPALQVQAPDAPPDAALEKGDEKRALEAALAQLDPEDRAMLVLREVEGRSYAEIAEITEKPLGTVKSGISRAREALRLKLNALLKDNGT